METLEKCIERLGELLMAKLYIESGYYNKRVNELNYMIKNLPQNNKQIGVISLNREDFHLWRIDSNLKPTGKDNSKIFDVDNVRYYCITRPEDIHGINFD